METEFFCQKACVHDYYALTSSNVLLAILSKRFLPTRGTLNKTRLTVYLFIFIMHLKNF